MTVKNTSNSFRRINQHFIKFGGLYCIVSLIIAIGSLSFSIWLSHQRVEVKNIPQKELTCTLNYGQDLIVKRTNDSLLELVYDGKTVARPHLISISVTNTGEYPISNKDFVEAFSISLVGIEKLLNCNINQYTNNAIFQELSQNTKLENNKVIIDEFLLNPGETFSLSIITDGKPINVLYNYRLEGISELTLRNTPKEKAEKNESIRNQFTIFGIIMMILLIVSLSIFFVYMKRFEKKQKIKLEQYFKKIEKSETDSRA